MRQAVMALAALLGGAASGFAAAPPMRGNDLTPGERREVGRLNEQCLKHVAAGDFAEAAKSVRKALAIRERRQGKGHWETVDLRLVQQRWASLSDLPEKDRRKLGAALGQAAVINRLIADDALARAERLARQAHADVRAVVGENHRESAESLLWVASLVERRGDHRQTVILTQKALATCRKALGEEHPRTAGILVLLGEMVFKRGERAAAFRLFQRSLEICLRSLGEGHPDTARSYNETAFVLWSQGRYREAQPLFERSLVINRQTRGEKAWATAQSYSNLAETLDRLRKHREARPLHEKGLAIRREILGEENVETALSYQNLAGNLFYTQQHARAAIFGEKALALRRKLLGDGHPDCAYSADLLGTIYVRLGKRTEAQVCFDLAVTITETAFGPFSLELAHGLTQSGFNLYRLGRYAEAARHYQRQLAICERWYGKTHEVTAQAHNNLGVNLAGAGHLARGHQHILQAWLIYRARLGEEHPRTILTSLQVGGSLANLGRVAEAAAVQERALPLTRKAYGESSPTTAQAYNEYASVLHSQGKYAAARLMYRKALAIRRRIAGEFDPTTALYCSNLGHHHWALGEYDEAQRLFEYALTIRLATLGETHHFVGDSYNNLASNLRHQGKNAPAQFWYEKALAHHRRSHGELHTRTADTYTNLAYCLWEDGKHLDAERYFLRAISIFRAVVGEDHPRIASAYRGYASFLWIRGRHREAVRQLQAARGSLEWERFHIASSGFDRAASEAHGANPLLMAIGLATLGQPGNAFEQVERTLARGLLDDLAAPSSEKGSSGQVLPLSAIQKQIPADAALVAWVHVPTVSEHWACVVRGQGKPAWVRLPGSGKGDVWTRADLRLGTAVYHALVSHETGPQERARLLNAFRRQRLDPLAAHLKARDGLPAVTRLFVVATGNMAYVPVEALTDDYRVSYVPSGSVFAHLAAKHRPLSGSSLLALGDPVFEVPKAEPPRPPDHGVLIKAVLPGSVAAKAGLEAGDVLLTLAGKRLESPDDVPRTIAAGTPATTWREGQMGRARLTAGQLGAVLDPRSARAAVRAWRQLQPPLAKRGTGHPRLPGSRLEAESIARFVAGSTVLLGSDASEQGLDQLAGEGKLKGYRLIHLATHGEIDLDRPERSALILAQDRLPDPAAAVREGRKVYTGRLTVRAIRQGWALDADLVTLSACQTGLGTDAGGDGLLGFAHALIQKGARSVVLSRWKVDDTATALLMVRFYENLLGRGKGGKALGRAAALDESKRWLRSLSRQEAGRLAALLAGGELRGTVGPGKPLTKPKDQPKLPQGDRPFAHPMYWAAFVLIGDGE